MGRKYTILQMLNNCDDTDTSEYDTENSTNVILIL